MWAALVENSTRRDCVHVSVVCTRTFVGQHPSNLLGMQAPSPKLSYPSLTRYAQREESSGV